MNAQLEIVKIDTTDVVTDSTTPCTVGYTPCYGDGICNDPDFD